MNDVELIASDEEKYLRMLSLAEGTLDESGFAEWLRPLLKFSTRNAVNEPRARYAR